MTIRTFILSEEQSAGLRRQLKQSQSSSVYRRATALLAVNQGTAVSNVASLLGVTRQTVYNWMAAYSGNKTDKNLHDAPRSGRPRLLTEAIDARIVHALAFSPENFGYRSNRWSAATLRSHVGSLLPCEVSDETFRRRLRHIGYTWKDGHYVRQAEANMTAEFQSGNNERQESVLTRQSKRMHENGAHGAASKYFC